jgi:MEDS: MEthanogen/methylotroph, DcmR Sensory domain
MRNAPGPAAVHAVCFYEDPDDLCPIVAEFIVDGLTAGQPTVVIARPRHRAGIVRSLRSRGIAAADLEQRGDLVMYDAESLLAQFFSDGRIDLAKLAPIFDKLLEAANVSPETTGIRAYGEMVDLLCERGHVDAAIELEGLWNQRLDAPLVSLLCGYARHAIADDQQLRAICRPHSHVVSAAEDLTSAR